MRDMLKRIFALVGVLIVTLLFYRYAFGSGGALQRVGESAMLPISNTYTKYSRYKQVNLQYNWVPDYTAP